MILVDSSVWIDHLRAPNEILSGLIERRHALIHPFVIGEIALGAIRSRASLITALGNCRVLQSRRMTTSCI